jgi:hypothetical protein
VYIGDSGDPSANAALSRVDSGGDTPSSASIRHWVLDENPKWQTLIDLLRSIDYQHEPRRQDDSSDEANDVAREAKEARVLIMVQDEMICQQVGDVLRMGAHAMLWRNASLQSTWKAHLSNLLGTAGGGDAGGAGENVRSSPLAPLGGKRSMIDGGRGKLDGGRRRRRTRPTQEVVMSPTDQRQPTPLSAGSRAGS